MIARRKPEVVKREGTSREKRRLAVEAEARIKQGVGILVQVPEFKQAVTEYSAMFRLTFLADYAWLLELRQSKKPFSQNDAELLQVKLTNSPIHTKFHFMDGIAILALEPADAVLSLRSKGKLLWQKRLAG